MNGAELRELLGRHGFRTVKSLGQNFLVGDGIPARIAASAGLTRDTHVLEIGPGVGALTRFLCETAGFVTAVELDKRLPPLLAERLAGYDNYEIISGDILKTDLAPLFTRGYSDLRVCANLPYNITSPALAKLLESKLFTSVTVMVQREVARRLAAKPGTADYGAFTVFTRYHAEVSPLFDVPPGAFFPPPKVTSSVVRLDIRNAPPAEIADEEFFFRIVRTAFGQRRKTLVNALAAGALGMSKERIAEAARDCGFGDTVRGETLGIAEFAALAKALAIRQ